MPRHPVHTVTPDEDLAAAAGVLSAARARRDPQASWKVRMGIWRLYGDVVVMHNGPLTDEQKAWVAVLRAGEGAVLAATSALIAARVRVTAPTDVQILIPWFRRAPDVPGARVRRSRLLTPRDVDRYRQPPRLKVARATIDATTLLPTPDDVRAMLCAPVQQRHTHVGDLRAAALGMGPVVGRSLILRTLDELELGASGIHEQRFSRICRRHRLPAPSRQALRRRRDGRAYLDAVWDEYALHVEIDGLSHLDVLRWADDLDRSNELEIDKLERRLRIPGFVLIEREAHVVDQLQRALRKGGWPG